MAASVTSLDGDLRKLRLDKYTPAAAKEARAWIEGILGDRLPSGDLLESLKDGVALCKLVNLALPPPGVKFKQSAMPFVQMENISHFLRACQQPPLNLQQHDTFLTVDLYESKDPAQVLQCLGAFSRAANASKPSAFPTAIGPRGNRGVLSPQSTGPATPPALMSPRGRGISNASNGSSIYNRAPALTSSKTGDSDSGRWSPTKSPTNTGSWSRREHEGATSPAWNIAQYGYMGGASQGNLGISFGGRRQITSAGPSVPNMAEKERIRKEKAAEEERQRLQMEEEEHRRRAEIEAEDERARLEEERRWEEETRRAREAEKNKAEEEKRRWEEEERQWKLTEERRRQEEEEAEQRLAQERHNSRSKSDARLRGQFLSQYQAEQGEDDSYGSRVRELEKELEQARQREQEYERDRQDRSRRTDDSSKSRNRSRSRPARPPSRQESWSRNEREVLRTEWDHHQQEQISTPPAQPSRSPRPLPTPKMERPAIPPRMGSQQTVEQPESRNEVESHRTGDSPKKLVKQRTGEAPPQVESHRTGEQPPALEKQHTGSRPLPDPSAYTSTPPATNPNMNRTDRYLASNPAPQQHQAPPTYSRELGATAERDAEDRRRQQGQQRTKDRGWAGKSLLEREMEMERQRQREWEESQQETANAVRSGEGVDGIGSGVGGRWDVGQWSGYTGGDNQNKGAQGIGAGRRQIVGPRPLPGSGGR